MSIPPLPTRLVELACQAPSGDNAQPWHWHVCGDRLTLSLDVSRLMPQEDPSHRNAVISCGAALDHFLVAARALGVHADVTRLPGGPDSAVLAEIRLAPGSPADTAADDIAVLRARCTDRRRLTNWPVPENKLEALVAEAQARGAEAFSVLDARARFRLEALTQREHLDSLLGPGPTPESLALVESSDGVIAVGGHGDGPADWLRTGEGLSALWLRATREGLAVVPLRLPPRLVGVADDEPGLTGADVVPHILVRVAWQAIGRSALPRTPRLPVSEVLTEVPTPPGERSVLRSA